jgi:hypothetical protein
MFITFRFGRDWEFRAMKTQALETISQHCTGFGGGSLALIIARFGTPTIPRTTIPRTTILRTTNLRTTNLRMRPFSERPFSERDHSPNDQSPKATNPGQAGYHPVITT